MTNSEELFDIVDDNNIVIGHALRCDCHGNPSLVHRAVHVLIFNPQGQLLLQKRSTNKDIQPGKWDTSVGGHLDLGESFLAAAHREMHEELGLRGLPLTFLYHSKIRNEIESENIQTYLAITDLEVAFNPVEISEVRYWQFDDIDRSLGTDMFTPNFEEEWQMFSAFMRRYQSGNNSVGLCAGDSFPDLWQELYADHCTDV